MVVLPAPFGSRMPTISPRSTSKAMAAMSLALHLRRFCGILHEDAPDESTVRKMTKRLGPELVDELIRSLIKKATSERRLRPRAMRCDSTVLEADIRYPTDINLVDDAVLTLVGVAGKAVGAVPGVTAKGAQPRPGDRQAGPGSGPDAAAQDRRSPLGGGAAYHRERPSAARHYS